MSNDLATIKPDPTKPGHFRIMCDKCKRHVETYELEHEIGSRGGDLGMPLEIFETGWHTVTVKCHGQEWQMRWFDGNGTIESAIIAWD